MHSTALFYLLLGVILVTLSDGAPSPESNHIKVAAPLNDRQSGQGGNLGGLLSAIIGTALQPQGQYGNPNQGGYPNGYPNQGGYPNGYPNQGGYPNGYPNQGGYPNGYPNQGGYPNGYPNQGGYPNGYPNQGGYPNGYPSQGGNANRYPNQGGYPNGYPNQGGYPNGFGYNNQNVNQAQIHADPYTRSTINSYPRNAGFNVIPLEPFYNVFKQFMF